MDFLGSAAFSKAVQALDTKTGMLVCLKIIKVGPALHAHLFSVHTFLLCMRTLSTACCIHPLVWHSSSSSLASLATGNLHVMPVTGVAAKAGCLCLCCPTNLL